MSPSGPPPAGTPVRVRMRKWPDAPHWEHDAVLLGADEHGTWLGVPAGTRCSRPGAAYDATRAFVRLVRAGAPWLASFYERGRGQHVDVYVDVATVPVWDATGIHAVDLDLDVVRGPTGRTWVDDEDEFADHRVRLGYPDDVVATALAACGELLAAVRAGEPPYDRVAADRWLEALSAGGWCAGAGAPAADRPGAVRPAGSPAGAPPA